MPNEIIKKITTKQPITFNEVINYIDHNYHFTPVTFKNGNITNNTNQNNGSCKIFAFAKIHQLSQENTLRLFGHYYIDVLNTPHGTDHQNIRNFITQGWDTLLFENQPLTPKTKPEK